MARGDRVAFTAQELPCLVEGPRAVQLTAGPGMHYVPYFYNPPLHPDGGRLLYVGEQDGTAQAYLLDRHRSEAVQLTEARGRDQHWSPYITVGVDGIRPQFVAWSQPDWQQVLFWEGNRLCRVDVDTLSEETLYVLDDGLVPQVPHCSAAGLIAFGYLPAAMQERFRQGTSPNASSPAGAALREELREGCGFLIYDLARRQIALRVPTPFWVNHVQASPDGRWMLFAQEGPWQNQRMHLYDAARGTWAPLRRQDDGVAIGHEFWISPTRVGYHGRLPAPEWPSVRGFFGEIDILTGERTERPSAHAEQFYGHYASSPDGRFVVTDGEASADALSLAGLDAGEVTFRPVTRHDWERRRDQRYHPHPHWSGDGACITFTGCRQRPDGDVDTQVLLLEPGAWRP